MRRQSMALLSSGYPAAFQGGLPCSGLLSIGVPGTSAQLPYPNLSLMRVPPHLPVGFTTVANLSAAYLQSAQLSDSDFSPVLSKHHGHHQHHHHRQYPHQQPQLHHTHGRTANSSSKRKGVTNFSIAGILGRDDEDCTNPSEKCIDASPSKTAEVPEESPANGPGLEAKVHVKTECLSSPKGDEDETDNPLTRFSWLQCTRYKPPRLPRAKRKDGAKKRKLGRNPRVPFSPSQVTTLEQKFRCTHYLSSIDVAELSAALNLSENRVKIWFQNRRARERRDKETASKDTPSSPSHSLMKPCGSPAPAAGPSPLIGMGHPALSPSPVDGCASAFTPLSYPFSR
ncbi:homeobox protein MSX-2-like [Patiria miniata]|uniref:Homeobox domain-containing protein n=1 Tax=Patiria miniata TaxID=46514 RepID=A0A914BAL2_PATMI|nr:homeobox protein MSX-2-like [Patiria miniata]